MNNNYVNVSWSEGIFYIILLCIIFIPYVIFLGFICILSGMGVVYRIFIKGEKRR